MTKTIRDQILNRIESIRGEIDAWQDVPLYDGMASASLALVYEQDEAARRLPILRQELDVWMGALAELERLTDSTRSDINDGIRSLKNSCGAASEAITCRSSKPPLNSMLN